MFKKALISLSIVATALHCSAQTGPEVTSWILNTTGATGYAGIETNVQLVQYSTTDVYISATCIPGYSIGPWSGSPATPSNQNFVFDIPRNPQKNTGTATPIGGGHIGILTNGVSIFGATDANSYNNLGVWQQNGYYFEYPSFDDCIGHPQQMGEYHHHVSPKCLYNTEDSTHHSPIIGYAFDGFPIYGAYAYTNINGTGAIKRMTSSYQLRSITDRTTLPDGTALTSANYGPAISSSYPLGCYIQDYVYTAGSGDLDEHNGRFCITPEYPAGIYAYFVTINAALTPVYPYTLGLTYYGLVKSGDVDSANWHGSGHVTITEPVLTYTTAVAQVLANKFSLDVSPNPATDFIHLFIQPIASNNFTATITDEAGRKVFSQKNIQPSITYTLDVSKLTPGSYILDINNETTDHAEKIVITR
jgi:YHYH protein/Secretion system C-terminal sorting domain